METQIRNEKLALVSKKIPTQETVWYRLSTYTTIMERDEALYRMSRSAQIGYLTLKNKLEKKRGSELTAGEVATFAEATGTDPQDWVSNDLYMTHSYSGGYTFLAAEDMVSSLQSTEAAEADGE